MTATQTLPPEILVLEKQLATQKDDLQRLAIIEKLTAHYAYTDVRRAQKLLSVQKEIIRRRDLPDFRLTYHLHTGFIENQLYNFRLAEMHYKDAVELTEERGDVQQQISVYIDYAGLGINNKRYLRAEEYLEKAAKLLAAYPNKKAQIGLLCRRGYLHLHYGEDADAIKCFLDSIQLFESLPDDLGYPDYYLKSLIYNGLGSVYTRVGNHKKGVKAHLQAANICETMGMRTRLSWFYQAVGTGHLSLGDVEAAEQYFLKAIGIEDDISQQSRAGSYASLGIIYASRNQFERTLELYERAEKLYLEKKGDSQSNLANIERLRGNLYKQLGKYKKAIRYYHAAYELANEVEDYRQLATIYNDMAECYAGLKDYANAYEYQCIHDGLSKKAEEQVRKQKISELELRNEAERARRERELMRLQTVELQAKALRAQMNPHFLFNALNSIQNFISGSEVEGADSAVRFLASFSSLMRKSLEYSEKQYISLEEELIFLKQYLEINAELRFEDRLTYEIIVDEEIEEDIMGVPTMVVQPYIENAIEHGLRGKMDGKVTINFILQDDEDIIRCIIQDNGIGRPKRREQQAQDPRFLNHQSRGTAITEERLRIAHGVKTGDFVRTYDAGERDVKEGTRVEILIPISEVRK